MTTAEANVSQTFFQNYLEILSSEHTAVDITLVEAHDTLMQSQGNQLSVHGTYSLPTVRELPNPLDPDSFRHQEGESGYDADTQNDPVQLKKADVVKVGVNCEAQPSIKPRVGDAVGSISVFKEEMEGVRNAVEKYRQEQLQLEEQLTRELQEREVQYLFSIEHLFGCTSPNLMPARKCP